MVLIAPVPGHCILITSILRVLVYVFVIKCRALFFLILGLQIFFSQNIKVGGGKKIKIKITIFFFLFNLKHICVTSVF